MEEEVEEEREVEERDVWKQGAAERLPGGDRLTADPSLLCLCSCEHICPADCPIRRLAHVS